MKFSQKFKNRDIEKTVDTILIFLEIKPKRRFIKNDGTRDFEKELNYIKKNLPMKFLDKDQINYSGRFYELEKAKRLQLSKNVENLRMEMVCIS